jgi:CSLREA domain-containing protein
MARGLVAVGVTVGLMALGAPAADATIHVNTTRDEMISGDGRCSLREAVSAANTPAATTDCPGADSSLHGTTTITLPAGVFRLTLGSYPYQVELPLERNASIQGASATDPAATRVDGLGRNRVFHVLANVQASISDLTVTGGRTRDGSDGKGVDQNYNGNGGSASGDGGGIYSSGTLTLTDAIVSDNSTGHGGGGAGSACGGGANGVGGTGGSAGQGGGIYNTGTLNLVRVTVAGNRTGDGGYGGQGGDNNTGAGCYGGVGGTGGDGGGIFNSGTLNIASSTIAGNATGNGGTGGPGDQALPGTPGAEGGPAGNGGGLANVGTTLTVRATTISANYTGRGGDGGAGGGALVNPFQNGNGAGGGLAFPGGSGAGLYNATVPGNTTSLTNSTITGNVAGDGGQGGSGGFGYGTGFKGGRGSDGASGGSGGGIYDLHGAVTVLNTTVSQNAAGFGGPGGSGGGALNNGGDGANGSSGSAGTGGGIAVDTHFAQVHLSIQNSLLASNPDGNCAGPLSDGGHNLSFPAGLCPHAVSGNPRLGPLANYGGSTLTLALRAGSAAINQVPASGAGCPPVDQRGVKRPQPSGGRCDIGAYEFAPPVCRAKSVSVLRDHALRMRLQCADPVGLAVRYVIDRPPRHGALRAFDPVAGRVTFTPRARFTGQDRFTFHAADVNGTGLPATVKITVRQG